MFSFLGAVIVAADAFTRFDHMMEKQVECATTLDRIGWEYISLSGEFSDFDTHLFAFEKVRGFLSERAREFQSILIILQRGAKQRATDRRMVYIYSNSSLRLLLLLRNSFAISPRSKFQR